jgi:hypothetical protein
MEQLYLDIYDFGDFEEEELQEAISDLKQFGVNDNELDLEYHDTE